MTETDRDIEKRVRESIKKGRDDGMPLLFYTSETQALLSTINKQRAAIKAHCGGDGWCMATGARRCKGCPLGGLADE